MEGLVMIYATISRHALKGQKLLAQGSALGNSCCSSAPCKGKSFKNIAAVWKLLPLQGVITISILSPGCCPGLGASALSGRMGNSYCLRAYGELFHFRFNIALGESRFDDVASLQLRGRTDAFAIFQRNAVTAFQQ